MGIEPTSEVWEDGYSETRLSLELIRTFILHPSSVPFLRCHVRPPCGYLQLGPLLSLDRSLESIFYPLDRGSIAAIPREAAPLRRYIFCYTSVRDRCPYKPASTGSSGRPQRRVRYNC